MNKLFGRLGFRKMDEMDRSIALKAQRNALIYVMVALLAWSLYESYKVYVYHTALNPAPCFLLVSMAWVQILSQLVLQRQAVKGDEEYKKENPIWKMLFIGAMIVVIIATIGAWLMIAGR